MRLLALRQNNLIFFGSLAQWPWQGRCWKNYPWEGHCSETLLLPPPFYRHWYKLLHTHTSPPPIPRLRRSLWTASLTSGSDQRRNRGCGTGWLLAGAGLLPLWHSRVFMVYVLLCWGVFPVLTLYSPRSIVWGLFFSPHLPHVMLYFFFPCLLAFHYWLYPVWLCMWRIIKNLDMYICICITRVRDPLGVMVRTRGGLTIIV